MMLAALLLSPSKSIRLTTAFRPSSVFTQHRAASLFLRGKHSSTLRLQASQHQAPTKEVTRYFSTLTVPELKALLREKNLRVSGKKYDLIQRLSSLRSSGGDFQENATVQVDRGAQENTTDISYISKSRGRRPIRQTQNRPMSTSTTSDDSGTAFGESLKGKRALSNGDSSQQKKVKSRSFASNAASDSHINDDVEETTASTTTTFQDIGVSPSLLNCLTKMGLEHPTPIQAEIIPHALTGNDVMGLAQTGTGKTLAFGIPLVEQLLLQGSPNRSRQPAVRSLILAPTRELANQIDAQLQRLTTSTEISTFVVVGGKNIQTQINKLRRERVDVLVATPGRLIDLLDRQALTLSQASFLVLDEADMMLDMGFLPSLKKIAAVLPKQRQTMLFSATMSKDMNTVAKSYLNSSFKRVEIARAGKTADKVTQVLHYIARQDKTEKLIDLLSQHERTDRALVFGRTKHGMEKLSKKLTNAGFKAGSIHGNKSQSQRDAAIAAFKSGAIQVLVATDVAARGLDIPDVKHVYNYELPNVPEAYVHRIGRTARAGKEGAAIAFCSVEEMEYLEDIEKVTGVSIPVASGVAWSLRESRAEMDRIKEHKKQSREQNQGRKVDRRDANTRNGKGGGDRASENPRKKSNRSNYSYGR